MSDIFSEDQGQERAAAFSGGNGGRPVWTVTRSYEYAPKNGLDDITRRGHSRSSGRVPPASLQIIGVADYRIRSDPDHDNDHIPRDARAMGQLFILILNTSYRSQAGQMTF